MKRLLLIYLGLMVGASALLSGQTPTGTAIATRPTPLTVPRIAPRAEADWTAEEKALVKEYSVDAGQTSDFRTLLNNPEVVKGMMPFYNYLENSSSLPPEDREILIMRTAWLTGSEYLWGHHRWAANKLGLTEPEIRRIAEGPDARGWNPFGAALVRAADEIHENSFISTPTWNALAERYGPAELVDAVFTVANFTMLAGAFNSLGVQVEVIASGVQLQKFPAIPFKVTVPEREPALTTARLKALEASEWTPTQKALLDPNNTGRALGLYRTFAHNTKLYPPRNTQSEQIRQHSSLSAHARELLILRTAWLTRCEYVWAQHVRQGRTAGLDIAKIPLGPDAPGWEPVDAALLRAADDLYRDDMITDATWKLLAAHLDTKQLIDVLVTAGGYRTTSMVGNSLGVQLEPQAERFPTTGTR